MSGSVKKCPECGEWSSWNKNYEDLCTHCGKPLSPVELKNEAELKELERQNKNFTITVVQIHEDDNFFVAGVKRVVQAVQLSVMAIVSFIIWLVTVVVG